MLKKKKTLETFEIKNQIVLEKTQKEMAKNYFVLFHC